MPEKTHMISVRLTDAERRKLSQICAVSGLPVSAAIREMIGGVTIRQRPPQELHDLYVEINRIGKNINQIVRKANAGFATKEDMVDFAKPTCRTSVQSCLMNCFFQICFLNTVLKLRKPPEIGLMLSCQG